MPSIAPLKFPLDTLAVEITAKLSALSDPARAENMARYMKYKQDFLGVPNPSVRTIVGHTPMLPLNLHHAPPYTSL